MLLAVAILMWLTYHFICACEGNGDSIVLIVLICAGLMVFGWSVEYGFGVTLITLGLIAGVIWIIVSIFK